MHRFLVALMVCFSPALIVAACTTQPTAPPTQYVTRTVTECSWAPQLTASAADTPTTKREIIAYEKARQTNCQNAK